MRPNDTINLKRGSGDHKWWCQNREEHAKTSAKYKALWLVGQCISHSEVLPSLNTLQLCLSEQKKKKKMEQVGMESWSSVIDLIKLIF